ncbi:hypothetical protein [Croceicoccus marinus]|uniref:Uncharacterized protein n=1 Tax=Croceicoccus marinus TaxID=450378 RepID=A0A7G6W180_9SPHN|nr:hypothetical protein [Croceicoccus marinus]QNE07745.1 hypothetical protein H4O24_20205 [Croceicoccus marinus]
MVFTDLSSAFRKATPLHFDVTVDKGRVFAMVLGQRHNLADHLPVMAENYLNNVRWQMRGQDLFWEYWVGEPATIGGTFCYCAENRAFRFWIWTEQAAVDLPSWEIAQREATQFLWAFRKAA